MTFVNVKDLLAILLNDNKGKYYESWLKFINISYYARNIFILPSHSCRMRAELLLQIMKQLTECVKIGDKQTN